MASSAESLYREITQFTKGSAAGLLQILVAAARRSTFQRIIACPTYPVPVRSSGVSLAVRQLHEAMQHPDVRVSTFFARLFESVRRSIAVNVLGSSSLPRRWQSGRCQLRRPFRVRMYATPEPVPRCSLARSSEQRSRAIVRRGENDPILSLLRRTRS